MKAVILAGGKGTRLRPLTVYTPKPIVPVMNRALLLYQIEILAAAGIDKITLSLSYQPDKIEDLLGDGSEYGVTLTYVTEPNPLGTAGAYRHAASSDRERTVVLNGDILTDLDVSAAIEFHTASSAAATLCVVSVDDPTAYGLVEIHDDGRIERFLEKPKPEEAAVVHVNTINAGIYILEPAILDFVPPEKNCSFEYDVFPAILERRLPFFAFIMKGAYWRDLGNPASYLNAHLDVMNGKLPRFEIDRRPSSDVATAASVDRVSSVGAGCVIKPGAQVVRSSLGPGVYVDEKAVIEDSVVWGHTRIAASAQVRGAVIGKSCYVGRNATVGAGAVLGDKTSISDYSRV